MRRAPRNAVFLRFFPAFGAAAALGGAVSAAGWAAPAALPARPAMWGEPFADTGADRHSIHGFAGEYKWLSNFYPCRVAFGGLVYGSAEAIYQSCKFPPADRPPYAGLDAAAAKRRAHSVKVDEAWWAAREDAVMRAALWAKFTQNPDLAARLLATGDKYLEETNWWDDEYWGVHDGKGKNVLGRLLMELRGVLRTEAAAVPPPAPGGDPVLFDLMARRLGLARQVAWAKFRAGEAVRDPARENALISTLGKEAAEAGYSRSRATDFFAAQMAAARRLETGCEEGWRAGAPEPAGRPLDLRGEIRPRLDAVSRLLLDTLIAEQAGPAASRVVAAAEAALRARGFPADVASLAARGL